MLTADIRQEAGPVLTGWSHPASDKHYYKHLFHFVLDVLKEIFIVPVMSVYQCGYSLN
jgi:hypothetical protein